MNINLLYQVIFMLSVYILFNIKLRFKTCFQSKTCSFHPVLIYIIMSHNKTVRKSELGKKENWKENKMEINKFQFKCIIQDQMNINMYLSEFRILLSCYIGSQLHLYDHSCFCANYSDCIPKVNLKLLFL